MISDADEAAITAYIESLDIEEWPPLTSTERDLVRRALASHEMEQAA